MILLLLSIKWARYFDALFAHLCVPRISEVGIIFYFFMYEFYMPTSNS